MSSRLFFQQLIEAKTSTYTYLLADRDSGEAVIIDPVRDTSERDLQLISDLGLKLLYSLETHVHADHVTGAGYIADKTGAKTGLSASAKSTCADLALKDGEVLKFGAFSLKAIACPGHTASCMCFLVGDRLFSGDALLIRGNGRTDFQEGSAETLYRNIHEKIFTLPDETLVYPAHDYKGFTSSTIGLEKRLNTRLGGGRSLEEFIKIMGELKLPPPKEIEVAVPANLNCGRR